MDTKQQLIIVGVFLALIAGVVAFGIYYSKQPGKYDSFAQCISDSKTIFYGTFWCPYCQNQKKMFGKSAQLLPYEECSTPDGQAQLAYCTEVGVESYPTWVFPDESRLTGVVSFETLAEKTGCTLP